MKAVHLGSPRRNKIKTENSGILEWHKL
jgi:hypothetical protein